MGKLVLIDGNSLLFRAYFAMRPMVTSSGVHTQGVFAFINMLNKIYSDHKPEYLAVTFDLKDKTFRHEKYSEYKAGRQQTPIELLSEIPYMHKVLEAMNIPIFELSGYEADDLIGTIAAKASLEGIETLIISGDKDELQLIDENTKVLITKKGLSEFDIYDIKAMKERYNLTPSQFIDLKGLMGDSSDNIPGIPGVGEKKGIALLEEYGSVESVIEHADEIKGKLGENVRNNIESAVLSKWLATIDTNAPIDFNLDDLKCREPDYNKLANIYKELEFNSFLKKIRDNIEADDEVSEIINLNLDSVKNVTFEEFIKKCPANSVVAAEIFTDSSHISLPQIFGICLFSNEHNLYCVRSVTELEVENIINKLADCKYSLCGFDVKPSVYSVITSCNVDLKFAHDVVIGEYLLDPNRNKYSISSIMLKYFKFSISEEDEKYASDTFSVPFDKINPLSMLRRLAFIIQICDYQKDLLEKNGLIKLFDECEMPLISTIAAMEKEGIRLDSSVLKDIGLQLVERIKELEAKICKEAGQNFNINSPKQLSEVLFVDMGIPYPKQKGKTSTYSTAADILEALAEEFKIAELILEYRKLTKLNSTYVEGLMSLIADDGKIHPHFMQTVAATGRLSCTEPNLQNIPIRDDYGRLIRKAFITENNCSFTGADYSQIELRIMASLSGDSILINAFNEGKDIHKATASRVFDVPFDKVTPLQRTRAKAVNFGVIYGMSAHGLSENLKISRAEAQKYINDYFETHSAVKQFLDKSVKEGEENRQVCTYFGRIRQIPEFESRKFNERELAKRLAMNTPIQGTAADVIKLAMNKVYTALNEDGLESKLILQIHDELIIEGPDSEVDAVKKILDDCMKSAANFAVELSVDIHTAKSWYDLK